MANEETEFLRVAHLKQYFKVGKTWTKAVDDVSFSMKRGVMYFGHLVELAGADELFEYPMHGYTQALLSAIPMPNPHYEKRRKRKIYTPEQLSQKEQQELELREIRPGHFVRCTPAQAEALKEQFV